MKRDEALRILQINRPQLQERGVKSIAIFGSIARDEARPESDIDVLVEFDRPVGLLKIADVKIFLEDLLSQEIDIVTPGALRSPARERILAEAIYA